MRQRPVLQLFSKDKIIANRLLTQALQSCYIDSNKPKAEDKMHHNLSAQFNYYFSFIYFSVDRAGLGFAGNCEMRRCF
jgi:hypothetical protein